MRRDVLPQVPETAPGKCIREKLFHRAGHGDICVLNEHRGLPACARVAQRLKHPDEGIGGGVRQYGLSSKPTVEAAIDDNHEAQRRPVPVLDRRVVAEDSGAVTKRNSHLKRAKQ